VGKPLSISTAERRRRLAVRHRLAPSARSADALAITKSLVALHASDPSTVHLSAIARMPTPVVASVERALYADRSIIRHHGMRRTVWVADIDTMRDVHAACTADIALNEWKQLRKHVEQTGIDSPDDWLAKATADTHDALRKYGPTTARRLGKEVPALTTKLAIGNGNYKVEAAAHTRILQNLGFDGTIVRTTPIKGWTTSEFEWSEMEMWLPGGVVGGDKGPAQAALVERYLRSFGPATTTDVQWWMGVTVGATKAALATIGAVEVAFDNGTTGWVLPDETTTPKTDEPWVAFLPSLDPTSMGWKERTWYFGELGNFGGPLFDRNGNAGPTVWVDGEVVGGWAHKNGRIVWRLLKPVSNSREKLLKTAADLLGAEIGPAKVAPRFPTNLQRELEATP
jgi:Winged helix DNA-binding domain